mgnify:FL=1
MRRGKNSQLLDSEDSPKSDSDSHGPNDFTSKFIDFGKGSVVGSPETDQLSQRGVDKGVNFAVQGDSVNLDPDRGDKSNLFNISNSGDSER